MRGATKCLLAVAASVIAVVSVPAAIPMQTIQRDVERGLAERLGQPVSVESLRFTILPRIQVVAQGVVAANGGLKVKRIEAVPVIRSLWSDSVVLASLTLEGMDLDSQVLISLLGGTAQRGSENLIVRRILIRDGRVVVGRLAFKGVNAEIPLGTDGRPGRIYATMQDGRVGLEVLPTASGALQLALQGRDWALLEAPLIRFDEVHATAILERKRLEAWNVQARVDKGSAYGFISLRWEPRWTLTGEFSLRGVPLGRLQGDGRHAPALEGLLDATPRFAARSRRAEQLLERLEIASDFSVRNAVVRRMHLNAAGGDSRGMSRQTGETRFERVSGHLAMSRGTLAFTGLHARARALVATGQVSVAPDRSLTGRISAQLPNSGGLLSVPLRVSGTLDDPRLDPTPGAIAGAAVGSVILPGVGTALGAKAGQLAEDLVEFLRN